MIEYIYFGTALLKKENRQLIASNVARMNLRNSDKQFTYDVQPPVGLSKKQK